MSPPNPPEAAFSLDPMFAGPSCEPTLAAVDDLEKDSRAAKDGGEGASGSKGGKGKERAESADGERSEGDEDGEATPRASSSAWYTNGYGQNYVDSSLPPAGPPASPLLSNPSLPGRSTPPSLWLERLSRRTSPTLAPQPTDKSSPLYLAEPIFICQPSPGPFPEDVTADDMNPDIATQGFTVTVTAAPSDSSDFDSSLPASRAGTLTNTVEMLRDTLRTTTEVSDTLTNGAFALTEDIRRTTAEFYQVENNSFPEGFGAYSGYTHGNPSASGSPCAAAFSASTSASSSTAAAAAAAAETSQWGTAKVASTLPSSSAYPSASTSTSHVASTVPPAATSAPASTDALAGTFASASASTSAAAAVGAFNPWVSVVDLTDDPADERMPPAPPSTPSAPLSTPISPSGIVAIRERARESARERHRELVRERTRQALSNAARGDTREAEQETTPEPVSAPIIQPVLDRPDHLADAILGPAPTTFNLVTSPAEATLARLRGVSRTGQAEPFQFRLTPAQRQQLRVRRRALDQTVRIPSDYSVAAFPDDAAHASEIAATLNQTQETKHSQHSQGCERAGPAEAGPSNHQQHNQHNQTSEQAGPSFLQPRHFPGHEDDEVEIAPRTPVVPLAPISWGMQAARAAEQQGLLVEVDSEDDDDETVVGAPVPGPASTFVGPASTLVGATATSGEAFAGPATPFVGPAPTVATAAATPSATGASAAQEAIGLHVDADHEDDVAPAPQGPHPVARVRAPAMTLGGTRTLVVRNPDPHDEALPITHEVNPQPDAALADVPELVPDTGSPSAETTKTSPSTPTSSGYFANAQTRVAAHPMGSPSPTIADTTLTGPPSPTFRLGVPSPSSPASPTARFDNFARLHSATSQAGNWDNKKPVRPPLRRFTRYEALGHYETMGRWVSGRERGAHDERER